MEEELAKINKYKNDKELNNIKINSKSKLHIEKEPIPDKNHKFCHLCSKSFDDYLTHINSNEHNNKKIELVSIYEEVNNCFRTIIDGENKENIEFNRVNNDINNNEDLKITREYSHSSISNYLDSSKISLSTTNCSNIFLSKKRNKCKDNLGDNLTEKKKAKKILVRSIQTITKNINK